MANTSQSYKFYLSDDYETIEIEEPKEIQNVFSVLQRDLIAHGVFFEFTENDIQLEFCGIARDFLEDKYKEGGTDELVTFSIHKRNNIGESFVEIFSSNVNYNTRLIDETYFKCSIDKISQLDDLKNRFDTKIDLSTDSAFDGTTVTPINQVVTGMHGKVIRKTLDVDGASGTYTKASYKSIVSAYNTYVIFGFDNVTQSDIDDYFTYPFQFDTTDNQADTVTINDLKKYIIKSKSDGTITLNAYINILFGIYGFGDPNFDYTAAIYYQVNSNTPVQLGGTYSASVSTGADLYQVEETIIDLEVDLREGDEFYFYFRIFVENHVGSILQNGLYLSDCTLDIVMDSVVKPSKANLYQIHDAVSKATEIITGQTGILVAPLLGTYEQGYSEKGCLSDIHIGSGWALRNFSTDNQSTKITYKDIFNSLNTLFALGYGFEFNTGVPTLRMEHYTYFYQDAEIIDLQEVDDYTEETAEELIYNELKFKFNKYANDEGERNTTDDFHTEAEYLTPIRKNKQEFSKSCPWIMSPYLIEKVRSKQFEENATESDRNDDDIFMIQTTTLGQTAVTTIFSTYDQTITVPLWYYTEVISYSTTFTVSGSAGNDLGWTYEYDNVVQTSTEAIISPNEEITYDETINCTIFDPTLERKAEKLEAFDYDGSISGLISPETSYNLRWTLARSLRYWAKWINSSLHYEESSQRITNTFFKNNGSLITELDTDECTITDDDLLQIQENYSPRISELAEGDRIWSPDIIKFQKKITADNINLIIDAHKNNIQNLSYTEDVLLEVEEDTLLEVNTNTFLLLDQEVIVEQSKNFGYISCRDFNGNKVSGYLLKMRYNIIDEICEFELLKKATNTSTSTYIKLLESGFSKLLESGDNKLLENG